MQVDTFDHAFFSIDLEFYPTRLRDGCTTAAYFNALVRNHFGGQEFLPGCILRRSQNGWQMMLPAETFTIEGRTVRVPRYLPGMVFQALRSAAIRSARLGEYDLVSKWRGYEG